jgi:excisionase family DNA binding protein
MRIKDGSLSVGRAAKYLGVTPGTLRKWQTAGLVTCERVGPRRDRRFRQSDLDVLHGHSVTNRREALYVRVSGRGDQVSSLAAQEAELRATANGIVVEVYADITSGLSELNKRRGLARLLRDARSHRFDVVRVVHRDRLARFGTSFIEEALDLCGVTVEILYPDAPETGLMTDFMALVASFSGRLYGQRSAAARQRLLVKAMPR